MNPKAAKQHGRDGSVLSEDAAEYCLTLEQEAELRRRQHQITDTTVGCDANEVSAWIESWGTANEKPQPTPRKIL